jgi:hypothetical protein
MTERRGGIRRHVPVVTLSGGGGLVTERREGAEDTRQWSRPPVEEDS